jgi:hypothetical protein
VMSNLAASLSNSPTLRTSTNAFSGAM